MSPDQHWQLILHAMRDVDPFFDLLYGANEPAAVVFLGKRYWALPQRGPNSRCAFLRQYPRLAQLAAGDSPLADYSDDAIILAAQQMGIPI